MPKTPEDTSSDSWHRFFAAQANNEAWTLAEVSHSRVNALALLNAAHASAWHWQAVGNVLNQQRAIMLLAQAHAVAGFGSSALLYANEMRAYFLSEPSTPDWELAFAHAIHANAAHAAGELAQHESSYASAESAIRTLADENDRVMVMRTFEHVPRP
ncbi:hypothetical protein I6J77_11985 [Rhodanobacter sp. FDAARGOS 1247]|uniref:hypothetical protein n=1 Tax=Rhodanobacter sp. FDAARGOS 1247 TaxID=2778082 RepID=UPI00194F02D7|nr:hypothetical protein [Rhodanobacter sp. FDAARGOS 1247]QRP62847.1 hypothetical protein I6J77_11985 [Rhodanobacter sp. FDAARGOS 1247]